MVKLIAADMDGTLLDDQKRLPNGFPKLLEFRGKHLFISVCRFLWCMRC